MLTKCPLIAFNMFFYIFYFYFSLHLILISLSLIFLSFHCFFYQHLHSDFYFLCSHFSFLIEPKATLSLINLKSFFFEASEFKLTFLLSSYFSFLDFLHNDIYSDEKVVPNCILSLTRKITCSMQKLIHNRN